MKWSDLLKVEAPAAADVAAAVLELRAHVATLEGRAAEARAKAIGARRTLMTEGGKGESSVASGAALRGAELDVEAAQTFVPELRAKLLEAVERERLAAVAVAEAGVAEVEGERIALAETVLDDLALIAAHLARLHSWLGWNAEKGRYDVNEMRSGMRKWLDFRHLPLPKAYDAPAVTAAVTGAPAVDGYRAPFYPAKLDALLAEWAGSYDEGEAAEHPAPPVDLRLAAAESKLNRLRAKSADELAEELLAEAEAKATKPGEDGKGEGVGDTQAQA